MFWCAALAVGLLQTWAHRNDMTPDGISYIEIAWAAARGGLSHLVNGYWSPLYPFLLSLEFRLFRLRLPSNLRRCICSISWCLLR